MPYQKYKIEIYCTNNYTVKIESVDECFIEENILHVKPTYENGTRYYPLQNILEYKYEPIK